MPSRQGPWWEALLDREDIELKSDIRRASVGPLGYLAAIVQAGGVDQEGEPRIGAMATLVRQFLSLPTSVRAKRAELVAEAMKHEDRKHRLPGDEWVPGHGLYAQQRAEESSGESEGYSPRGLS